MTTALQDLLAAPFLDIDAIARSLDQASPVERLAAVRSIDGATQAKLFGAAEGRAGLSLEFMVPASLGPLREVIHEGRNNLLPGFRTFQKRFCRHPTDADALVGYNEQTMRWATGPGYYTARMEGPELAIDYTELPTVKPDAWPPILKQSSRLGFAVYAHMIDMLRPVSQHVTIGRAFKKGKALGNYFLLCRQP